MRALATPSRTLAMSDSRTTALPLVFSTSPAKSRASRSWPFKAIVSARSLPSKPPTGPLTLVARSAVTTSCIDRCAAASAAGSTRTRTAGFSEPLTCTCPTPGTCAKRWPSTESARS